MNIITHYWKRLGCYFKGHSHPWFDCCYCGALSPMQFRRDKDGELVRDNDGSAIWDYVGWKRPRKKYRGNTMTYTKDDLIMHFSLQELHNIQPYAGCLEGPPPLERGLKEVREWAEKNVAFSTPIVVVPPEVKERSSPWRAEPSTKLLPQWAHIGLYTSSKPVKDKTADGSHLCIIWYNDKAQCPLANKDIILQVDWDAHARDYSY